MKIALRFLLVAAFASLLQVAQSQTLSLLSNPDAGQGFAGWTILYNNAVYSGYTGPNGSLAKYDGTSVTIVPSPDAGSGFNGNPIVYNGNLYYGYLNVSGIMQLAKYNGSSISLVSNPSSGQGFYGCPIVFNGNLYFRFLNASSIYQLAKYDGTSITLINNPDAGGGMASYTPVIYNNNLYFDYYNASNKTQLAKYDGSSSTLSLVSNPDAGNASMYSSAIWNGNLYFSYTNTSGYRVLGKYDGTTITSVANPDASNGFAGKLIVYNNTLYFRYLNSQYLEKLAKYDGSTITLVPGFGSSDEMYDGKPIIYNNTLYFPYFNSAAHSIQLAKYDGSTLSLVANPDAGYGFVGISAIYNGSLIWAYQNANNTFQLVRHNGSTNTLVPNPDANQGVTPDIYYNAMVNYNGALCFGYRGQSSKMQLAKYVLNANQWQGNSSDWSTAGNWSYGTVPVGTEDVLIPATANNPVISAASTTNSVTIQGNATLTVNSGGSLSATNGVTVTPGSALVGSSANITGTITLQQAVSGQRGWRVFANPFATATNIATVASNNGIAIGTTIPASGLTDSRTYSNASDSWANVTGNTWAANTPYALFIRGLAGEVTGSSYTAGPSAFTYSVSGTLNGANTTLTPTVANHFMVTGNPYAAPVTTSALTNGVGKPYYVYQISQGANQTAQRTKAGSWVAQLSSSTTATLPVLGALAWQPAATTAYNITTSDINTGGTVQTSVFGEQSPVQYLELNITQQDLLQDKLFVRIGEESNGLTKFVNDNVNLYAIDTGGGYRAIDARKAFKDPIVIGISAAAGNYTFTVVDNTLANVTVSLKDNLLHTQTELSKGASYAFSITADTASKGEHRFELVFVTKMPVVNIPAPAATAFTARVLGNPVNNAQPVKVEITGSTHAIIQVKDATGKTIATQAAVNGTNYVRINPAGAGMYILQVSDGDTSVVNKVIIE